MTSDSVLVTVLKVGLGIAGPMFVMWGIVYSPRENYRRYATVAAVVTGVVMSVLIFFGIPIPVIKRECW